MPEKTPVPSHLGHVSSTQSDLVSLSSMTLTLDPGRFHRTNPPKYSIGCGGTPGPAGAAAG
jgi:hypothetical protein